MKYNIISKELYNLLKQDEKIQKIYKQIEEKEIQDGGWAFHNYEHIKNVSKIAEEILKSLNFDEETIYSCKIACLLHDVGAIEGKVGHTERSYEYAKALFEDNNYLFKDKDVVLDAIKKHSDGFESDNIVALAIILADKLDIKKTRISEEGKKVIGNRQYQHIEDIVVNINDNKITVNFITDGNLDLKETNEYYFTKKVFKAIQSFSNKLGLNYYILLDNNPWYI
jgi:HD superfamily phosphodiesterase